MLSGITIFKKIKYSNVIFVLFNGDFKNVYFTSSSSYQGNKSCIKTELKENRNFDFKVFMTITKIFTDT